MDFGICNLNSWDLGILTPFPPLLQVNASKFNAMITRIVKSGFSSNQVNRAPVVKSIEGTLHVAPSLKSLCGSVINASLDWKLKSKVSKLPLPTRLKEELYAE